MAHEAYPIIDSVLHPTDFSPESLVAFHHALKIALIARSQLALLHVALGNAGEEKDFPEVRNTLERWGLLPPDSARSAVADLGIHVSKIIARKENPVDAVLRRLERNPADLIVLAAHQHGERSAWQRHSDAEPIARRSGQMTLFIPEGSDGFVSSSDGAVLLESIVIPVAQSPSPQPAVEAAARLVSRVNCQSGTFTLLHVGDSASFPEVECPEVPGWTWKRAVQTGDVIEGIVAGAKAASADLVIMSTDGRNGFLDAFRGSHSERVLRQIETALLAVPAGSLGEARLTKAAHPGSTIGAPGITPQRKLLRSPRNSGSIPPRSRSL